MKVSRFNIIRALFLLIVFSLNTIVGFACSIGVDMVYNSSHHQHSFHASEKVNSYKSEPRHSFANCHDPGYQTKQTSESGTSNNTQDDCCANDVTKFIQLDKSVVKTNLGLPVPAFFVALTSIFIQPSLNEDNLANSSLLLLARRSCSIYHTDIRIAIQSFQI